MHTHKQHNGLAIIFLHVSFYSSQPESSQGEYKSWCVCVCVQSTATAEMARWQAKSTQTMFVNTLHYKLGRVKLILLYMVEQPTHGKKITVNNGTVLNRNS